MSSAPLARVMVPLNGWPFTAVTAMASPSASLSLASRLVLPLAIARVPFSLRVYGLLSAALPLPEKPARK